MDNLEEKACYCALGRIFGFEPRITLALISHFGSAAEVFRVGTEKIDEILGPYSKYKGKVNIQAAEKAYEELLKLSEAGINFIGWNEDNYPTLLKECEDAPAGIYIRSETPAKILWQNKNLIAIVGTRDISPYGQEWCEKLTSSLANCKNPPIIVSGLALGTDFCAHKTAIEAGLATIGVMATGPEQVYPSKHRQFAEHLVRTPGCALITDYPPKTPPLAIHFLRRNRIIAGLCRATILIESKIKGGAMNTARLAFSYNRDIYALPGRADDIQSQGCNALIKEKIAEPITDVESFIENLGMKSINSLSTDKITTDKEMLDLSCGKKMSSEDIDRMCAILIEVRKSRGITIEELAIKIGLPFGITTRLVAILETEDFIKTDILQRCSINAKKV